MRSPPVGVVVEVAELRVPGEVPWPAVLEKVGRTGAPTAAG